MSERPIHVLLVDDDEDEYIVIRELLAELHSTRFKVDWVGRYEEALEKMARRDHDVYLIDFRLGAHTGLDLVRTAVQRGLQLPMILLTGFDDENIDRQAIGLGAADYLKKGELSAYLLERSIRYAIYRMQMRAQAISQDRMASIGMLASSLAHEIGTPLGVIRGRAEYLGMQLEGADADPSIRKNVEIILGQIDRVSHLIRSLLNLAKGDQTGESVPTSMRKAVNDVLELMAHDLRKNAIEVVNRFEANGEMTVFAQPQQLHQVLLNFVVNAIHAIQKARAEGRQDGHQLRISSEDLGASWSLRIEDTGCGIHPDEMPNLFRPFYTTKQDGVGTGLGLATSQWIVRSWNGSIDVESRQGTGTAFTIHIPKQS